MDAIVEVSQEGTLQLPTEILQAIQPNTRFAIKVERDRLILSPIPPAQPFWATAFSPDNDYHYYTLYILISGSP